MNVQRAHLLNRHRVATAADELLAVGTNAIPQYQSVRDDV